LLKNIAQKREFDYKHYLCDERREKKKEFIYRERERERERERRERERERADGITTTKSLR